MAQQLWFEAAYTGNRVDRGVLFTLNNDSIISGTIAGVVDPPAGAQTYYGLAFSGAGNAYSRCGQHIVTHQHHSSNLNFQAHLAYLESILTPQMYYRIARAVFTEMLVAGYTAVGEYHAVGRTKNFDMELALVRAAVDVGIRLVILDAHTPPDAGVPASYAAGLPQSKFIERHNELDRVLAREFGSHYVPYEGHGSMPGARSSTSVGRITLGTAIHIRPGTSQAELRAYTELTGSLHVHYRFAAETHDHNAVAGITQQLAQAGLLSSRLSAVHATGLSEADILSLAKAQAAVVVCPSADGVDSLIHVPALAQAGVRLAIGAWHSETIDPLIEVHTLGQGLQEQAGGPHRLRTPLLMRALTRGGPYAIGLGTGMALAGPADFFVLDWPAGTGPQNDVREVIARSNATNVAHVIVGGKEVARNGRHLELGSPRKQCAMLKNEFDLAGPGGPV